MNPPGSNRHPCVLLAGFYLAGRAAITVTPWDRAAMLILIALVAFGAGVAFARRSPPGLILACMVACLAGAVHGTRDPGPGYARVPFIESEITGRVLEMPERSAAGDTVLRLDVGGLHYRLKVRRSGSDSGTRLLRLRRDDQVRVWARAGLPEPYANPLADSPALALRSAGIDRVGTVKSALLVERLTEGPPGLFRAVDGIRARFRTGLDKVCPDDGVTRGLLGAMLLGDRAGLQPAVVEDLRAAGLVHLIAVSGLHVGLILLIVLGALYRMPVPTGARLLISPVLLACVVLLLGTAASILRAAAMALIAGWGRRFGRSGGSMNTLSAVGLLLVALEPAVIHNPGFVLSFSATAGILLGYPRLRKLLPLPAFPAVPLSISAAAYLGTVPWTASMFGTVAPVSLLSNLGSAPLCGLILLFGYPAMFLAAAGLPTLGAGAVAQAGCRWLVDLAGMTPGSILQVPAPSLPVVAGLLALVPLMARRNGVHTRTALFLVLSVAMICLHLGPPPPLPENGVMKVAVPDVGQGQAVLLQSGGGAVLVDAGGSRSLTFDIGARIVAPQLSRIGIRRLDILAISHEHLDHAGGAGAILKRVEVGQLWIPPGTVNRPAIRPLTELALQAGVPVILAGQGTVFHGSGWTLRSLHPGMEDRHLSVNDRSLVLRFSTEQGAALLPGDLEQPGEESLIAALSNPDLLDADLLVAGHHGAADSSSLPFLRAVSPRTVLISAGRGNRFGHPDPDTVERYRSFAAAVASTARDGFLRWRIDSTGWTLTGHTTGDSAGRPEQR